MMFVATAAAAAGSEEPVWRIVNSSPPKRANKSVFRMTFLRRSTAACSSRSPTECPSESLTSLKPSMSIMWTANCESPRRLAAKAVASSSLKTSRLAMPVRVSVRASLSSRSVVRADCRRNTKTIPVTIRPAANMSHALSWLRTINSSGTGATSVQCLPLVLISPDQCGPDVKAANDLGRAGAARSPEDLT